MDPRFVYVDGATGPARPRRDGLLRGSQNAWTIDESRRKERCLIISITPCTTTHMPPWLLVVPLPRYDNPRAKQPAERSRRFPSRARPCPRRTGAASGTRSGEGRRATACASARATRTPVPSISRAGLMIVGRLRLLPPTVGGGLRAVWRSTGHLVEGCWTGRPVHADASGVQSRPRFSSTTSVGLSIAPPRTTQLAFLISFPPASVRAKTSP